MKSKMPEILALILVVVALLIPPWKVMVGLPDGVPLYATKWALVFEGPSVIGQIDAVLILIELLAIAGVYFLLRSILKPPRT
jgi:hypothetical protein